MSLGLFFSRAGLFLPRSDRTTRPIARSLEKPRWCHRQWNFAGRLQKFFRRTKTPKDFGPAQKAFLDGFFFVLRHMWIHTTYVSEHGRLGGRAGRLWLPDTHQAGGQVFSQTFLVIARVRRRPWRPKKVPSWLNNLQSSVERPMAFFRRPAGHANRPIRPRGKIAPPPLDPGQPDSLVEVPESKLKFLACIHAAPQLELFLNGRSVFGEEIFATLWGLVWEKTRAGFNAAAAGESEEKWKTYELETEADFFPLCE